MKNTLKLTLAVVLGVASVASVFAAAPTPTVANKSLHVARAQAILNLRVAEARDAAKVAVEKLTTEFNAAKAGKAGDELAKLTTEHNAAVTAANANVNADAIKGMAQALVNDEVKIEDLNLNSSCGSFARAKDAVAAHPYITAAAVATAVVAGGYYVYTAGQADEAAENN